MEETKEEFEVKVEVQTQEKETFTSDSEYTDSRSLILKEYLNKYIISGIDEDIYGETLLTHSSYLNDNDVMIIQWIKHMYSGNEEVKELMMNEKAICIVVNYADRLMQDFQMNNKDVTPKEMENIMKKSISSAKIQLGTKENALIDCSKLSWFTKIKQKILEYFNKNRGTNEKI